MVSDEAQVTHTAVLTPGEDGFVCAQIAEVLEAISQGRTIEEATANVAEALELALQWRRDEGRGASRPRGSDVGSGHRRSRLTCARARAGGRQSTLNATPGALDGGLSTAPSPAATRTTEGGLPWRVWPLR